MTEKHGVFEITMKVVVSIPFDAFKPGNLMTVAGEEAMAWAEQLAEQKQWAALVDKIKLIETKEE